MLPPIDSSLMWFGMGVVVMALFVALGFFLIWLSAENERAFVIVLAILIMFLIGGPLGLMLRETVRSQPQQNIPAEKP